MKRIAAFMLLCVLLTLNGNALAIKEYHPGDTFQVKFSVDKNPHQAVVAAVRFLYNHKVFKLVSADGNFQGDYGGLINLNGLSKKDAITATFRVIRGAETGTCKITPRVINSSGINEMAVDGLTMTTHTVKVSRPNPTLPWPDKSKSHFLIVFTEKGWLKSTQAAMWDAFDKAGVKQNWVAVSPENGTLSRKELRDAIDTDFDCMKDYTTYDAVLLFPFKGTNYNDLIDEITEHGKPVYVFQSENGKKVIEEFTALYKKKK